MAPPNAIDPSQISFVTLNCVTYAQDGDTWGRNKPPAKDLFFSDEASMRVCIDSMKYPCYVVRVAERVAMKIGDTYHPLGTPVTFTTSETVQCPSSQFTQKDPPSPDEEAKYKVVR